MHTINDILRDIRFEYLAASIVIVSLFNASLAPSSQDMPVKWKMVLTIIACGTVFGLVVNPTYVNFNIFLLTAIVFVVSIVSYQAFFQVNKYQKSINYKTITAKITRSKNLTNTTISIVGGRLHPHVPAAMLSQGLQVSDVQDFYRGNQYDEDKLWTRSSRAFNQVILVLFYCATVISAMACLTIMTLYKIVPS